MFLSDKHGLGIGLIDYISTMSNPNTLSFQFLWETSSIRLQLLESAALSISVVKQAHTPYLRLW